MKPSSFIPAMLLVAGIIAAISVGLYKMDPTFSLPTLLIGDGVMFLISMLGWLIVRSQLSGGTPQAFVRAVSTNSLMKLFLCGAGIVAYALATKGHRHTPTLLTLCGIYFIFTMVEAALMSRMARNNKE